MTLSRNPQSAQYRRFKRRRISTTVLTIRIAALTLVATLVIGAGIAWQLSQGEDPSLGPKAEAATRTQTTKTSTSSAAPTSSDTTSGSTQSSGSSDGYTSSGSSNLTSSYPSSSPAPVTSSAS